MAVVRALGSPVLRGAGGRASVGRAFAWGGPDACSPARALTYTWAYCTRDLTYIVTLKDTRNGCNGDTSPDAFNDYPGAPAPAITCIIRYEVSVREATSVRAAVPRVRSRPAP